MWKLQSNLEFGTILPTAWMERAIALADKAWKNFSSVPCTSLLYTHKQKRLISVQSTKPLPVLSQNYGSRKERGYNFIGISQPTLNPDYLPKIFIFATDFYIQIYTSPWWRVSFVQDFWCVFLMHGKNGKGAPMSV